VLKDRDTKYVHTTESASLSATTFHTIVEVDNDNGDSERVKAGTSLPVSLFLDVDTEDEEELLDALVEKWDNMSYEKKLSLIEDVDGRDVVENMAFFDKYRDGDLVEVLHEY
jgi:hypothetical protein